MIEGLKTYTEYKESGVPWLGKIPKSWDIRRGKYLFRFKKELNTNALHTNVLSLTMRGVVNNNPDDPVGMVPNDYASYQLFRKNDLVFKLIDLENFKTSRVGLVHEDGIMSPAYIRLSLINGGDIRYFYHQFFDLYLRGVFNQLGAGVRATLGSNDLLDLGVVLPGFEEQTQIVRYLDKQDHRINRLIRDKRQLIELLNEQKHVIIHKAVTRGLDPNVSFKPSGIDWLGDVPKHWEVMPIKRVLSRLIDTEHKTAPAVEGGRYMVVRTTNIKKGRLVMEKAYFTDENGFRSWTRREVPQPGDILFTREAPAGEACLVPGEIELCMGQRVVLMRVDSKRLDPRFVLLLIYHGAIRDYISLKSQGSTVPHFNMSDIASMPALVPPMAEQQEMIIALNIQTKSLDITIEQSRREIDLLREYRTRLISDVITGKLDVRGVELPAMDVAEVKGDIDIVEDIETEAQELIESEEVADADE